MSIAYNDTTALNICICCEKVKSLANLRAEYSSGIFLVSDDYQEKNEDDYEEQFGRMQGIALSGRSSFFLVQQLSIISPLDHQCHRISSAVCIYLPTPLHG